MTSRVSRDRMERLVTLAAEKVMRRVNAVADALVDRSGGVWGDEDLDRPGRILATLDKAERGVLDRLYLISPKTAQAITAQLRKDAEAEGLL